MFIVLLVNVSNLHVEDADVSFRRYLGGYCGGVPPLPIPNREVKPACADGTAMQCGRVGSCLFSSEVFIAQWL